jgi:trimeric autotransporter adhesin
MKYFLHFLLVGIPAFTLGQVAISPDNSVPDSTAMLDVKSSSKGLLIPRLTAAQRSAITAPAASLLIYQTDATAGIYINNGTATVPNWQLISTNASSWSTSGNNSIAANHFIGTTDNTPVRFRINNISAGSLDPVNQNVSLGLTSLSTVTTGKNNVAIGTAALKNSTTGNGLVAIGDSALYSQTTSNAYFNTAVGSRALYANTIGYENTAVGFASLTNNTLGVENAAFGDGALRLNINGNLNSALGYHALYYNISGRNNTALGAYTMLTNKAGGNNSVFGMFADVFSDSLQNATAVGFTTKVDASNKVRIGNTEVTSIGGQVGWTTFSDARYKSAVSEDVSGLAFIKLLRPVSYGVDADKLSRYYGDAATVEISTAKFPRQSGFLAQEVEASAISVGYNFSGIDKPSNH